MLPKSDGLSPNCFDQSLLSCSSLDGNLLLTDFKEGVVKYIIPAISGPAKIDTTIQAAHLVFMFPSFGTQPYMVPAETVEGSLQRRAIIRLTQ